MLFKFMNLFAFFLLILLSLKAERAKEKYLSVSPEDSSQQTLKSLKNIHNFRLIFDDYSLRAIAYEPFE